MRDVGGDDGSDLRALVSHRYVIEVLDALSNGPMTLRTSARQSTAAGGSWPRPCGWLPPVDW
jgi:hypothetical protein